MQIRTLQQKRDETNPDTRAKVLAQGMIRKPESSVCAATPPLDASSTWRVSPRQATLEPADRAEANSKALCRNAQTVLNLERTVTVTMIVAMTSTQ